MIRIDYSNPILVEDMEYIDKRLKIEEMKGSKILITGASGMIASYIVAYLIYVSERKSMDLELFLAVRNINKAKRIFGDRKDIHYISYDANVINTFEERYDYIIHGASLASPQYYGKNPVETMLPNVIGIYNILEHSKNTTVKKVLFLSTGSVYGDLSGTEKVDESYVGNMNYLARGNEYGESKRCGEALCLAYHREYGLPVVIARIYHSYGPTMDYENDSRVFSEFVNNAINNVDIELKSEGKERRSFCYISDLIIQLLSIIIDGKDGDCYNVGNPYENYSIGKLADIVSKIPVPPINVVRIKRNDEGYCSSPLPPTVNFSTDKIEEIGGFRPQITVSQGFSRTLSAIRYDKNYGD